MGISPREAIIIIVAFSAGMMTGAGLKWAMNMVWKIIEKFVFGNSK